MLNEATADLETNGAKILELPQIINLLQILDVVATEGQNVKVGTAIKAFDLLNLIVVQ